MTSESSFEEFKKQFLEELEGITDINVLKDLYAVQIAKKDKLIFDLQKQNEVLLKTAFKEKREQNAFNNR